MVGHVCTGHHHRHLLLTHLHPHAAINTSWDGGSSRPQKGLALSLSLTPYASAARWPDCPQPATRWQAGHPAGEDMLGRCYAKGAAMLGRHAGWCPGCPAAQAATQQGRWPKVQARHLSSSSSSSSSSAYCVAEAAAVDAGGRPHSLIWVIRQPQATELACIGHSTRPIEDVMLTASGPSLLRGKCRFPASGSQACSPPPSHRLVAS